MRDDHKQIADEYTKTGSQAQVIDKTGKSASAVSRALKRPDVQAYLSDLASQATERAVITKAEVIARTAEILDISLCRRPLRIDQDGEAVFLKAPNLPIAARMVEKLGDATGAWQSGDAGRPAAAMNVGTLIMGDGSGSLVDAMIERIKPGATIEHQPESEH